MYPSGVESGYLTKDIECKLFLTTPKCKITVKNNKFDKVSSSSTKMDDSVKNCVEEFTNEIIIYMQNYQNTELGMSKDNPPQQLYKWIYKKNAQTIIKKGISANGKVQVIDTYKKNITFETAKIPKDFSETFVSTDLETITIEGKEYCKFLIENKAYYVSKNFVDQNKKNLLEEFNSKCISVNLKKNAISTNEICPEDKLVLDKKNINEFKQNLIDKLSEENDYLMQYVMPADGSEDYNIYNESKYFYELLSQYLKRIISKHPLEWDFAKIKEDRVCESRGKPPVNEKECCDIAAGLKTADPKIFGTNSFYFVCAPYFYNKMDELGLFEFNPYEKNTDNLPTCVEPITHCSGKDNPGFAPISYTTTNYKYNGIYYARITGHFNDWYGSYYHEGVDFEGSVGTPIHSFICGKVVMMKNQKNKHYGLSVLIQKNEKEDGKNVYYLLGHLSEYASDLKIGSIVYPKNVYYLLGHLSEYASDLKIGSIVYPGKVIGTVGNSGNCYTDNHKITSEERAEGKGSHLHLSFYKTEKPISKLFVNDNFITYYMENEIFESDLFNPFSHNEGRNFK